MTRPRRYPSRAGFTLTELLVAITVLAILAGFLVPAVLSAFSRAREATIIMEMKQLEMALEQFKNDFGFYPPSFARGVNANGETVGIQTASDLRRYVNRMSPNNAESTPAPGVAGKTRLEHWWDEVGVYLDQESSLVFWLCGTCKNKQFPVTGGATSAAGTPPLVAHSFNDDGIERHILFEFKRPQLFGDETDGSEVVQDTNGFDIPINQRGFIYEYQQAHGASDGDKLYRYRDAASYDIGALAATTFNDAYRAGLPDGSETTAILPPTRTSAPYYDFVNPNSFQLVTAGMDGLPGAAGNVNAALVGTVTRTNDGGSTVSFVGYEAGDNLCNFAEGRLEKFVQDNLP